MLNLSLFINWAIFYISQDELDKNSVLTNEKLPDVFKGKCQVSQKYISDDIFLCAGYKYKLFPLNN